MQQRNKQADLHKFANEIINLLNRDRDEYYIGIDGKRPFGFAYRHAQSVLEIVGMQPDDAEGRYSEEQLTYSWELQQEVVAYIQKIWNSKSVQMYQIKKATRL
jgi:hypothetical protein